MPTKMQAQRKQVQTKLQRRMSGVGKESIMNVQISGHTLFANHYDGCLCIIQVLALIPCNPSCLTVSPSNGPRTEKNPSLSRK